MQHYLDQQRDYFRSLSTLTYPFRRTQLLRLKAAILKYEKTIQDALEKDLGKSSFESYTTEVGYVLSSIDFTIKNLRRWMKKVYVRSPIHQIGATSYIYQEPLGSVLIIGPFNYPFQLVIEPLIGALAAGNTAIVKPSEFATNTQAVLTQLIGEVFEPDYVRVITGDHVVTQQLIQLPFDHIFFTGSTRVGKIVYEAAAKNLVPVTLELGGKSPTIVDETANIKVAAKRIVFGKFLNSGQTCIAPDYIYAHVSIKEALVQELKAAIDQFYPPQQAYGNIINERHHQRLSKLIPDEKVVYRGASGSHQLHLPPTIVDNVNWQDEIMQEELFGPLLPILTYTTLDEVITTLKNKDKPLALYLFSEDKATQERVWSELSFGGGAINDTIMHVANPHLPFGGVGSSGIGAYHGKASFDTFSHRKATVQRTTKIDLPLAYPPYTKRREQLIRKILK